MMYSKLCDIAAHAIRVQDSADHVYNLPHPVAQPSLYVTIDVRLEMLQKLLAIGVHATSLFFCRPTARCEHPAVAESRRDGSI